VKKIEFLEDTHQYLYDGVLIPSVSAIIRDDRYSGIPIQVLERAAYKGTQVHKATEMIDKKKKVHIEDEYTPYVLQYALWKLEHLKEWTDVETIVYTQDYAGTVDRIQRKGDEILICDIKTTSKLHEDSIALQLAAYIIAHADMEGNDLSQYTGAVLWLNKDRYKFKKIEPDYDGFRQKLQEYKENHVQPDNADWDLK
jgi:hypothetical protein